MLPAQKRWCEEVLTVERDKVIIELLQKLPNLKDSRIFYLEGRVDVYLELDEKEQNNKVVS